VSPLTPVREVIATIDAGRLGLAVVTDEVGRLLGIVTDVDVRKGLLRGMRLDDPAASIMCATPSLARPDTTRSELLALMHRTGIRQVPVVDFAGRVLGVEILKDLTADAPARQTEVVIMAGGRGARLRPLTDETPKPMLPIGGRPLLEILVERLRQQGFTRLTLAVRYKRDVIERHFGDGTKWGVTIRYVREGEAAGTAGALFLLDPRPAAPFLVVNGDLLTDLSFERLVEYHVSHAADLTVCAKAYRIEIPFGVVDLAGEAVTDLREKPGAEFYVNAGIYVLSPAALDRLSATGPLDMPDLVRHLLAAGARVTGFPVREKWFDIGTAEDYRRAADDYEGAGG
jgi:dTDP-glucose pyrophosphorylase